MRLAQSQWSSLRHLARHPDRCYLPAGDTTSDWLALHERGLVAIDVWGRVHLKDAGRAALAAGSGEGEKEG